MSSPARKRIGDDSSDNKFDRTIEEQSSQLPNSQEEVNPIAQAFYFLKLKIVKWYTDDLSCELREVDINMVFQFVDNKQLKIR